MGYGFSSTVEPAEHVHSMDPVTSKTVFYQIKRTPKNPSPDEPEFAIYGDFPDQVMVKQHIDWANQAQALEINRYTYEAVVTERTVTTSYAPLD